jgi:predicted metal-binding protein
VEKNLGEFLNGLKEKATKIGASDATIIDTAIIPIEDAIIEYCKKPLCASYGKSAHCPPHAPKPAEARKLLKSFQKALLFKIGVATKVLMTDESNEAFRKTYEIASELEAAAQKAGFVRTKGLAAGSCLPVFCKKNKCQVVEEGKKCRFPSLARPSMEAVGINVFKLVQDVGWEIQPITRDTDPDSIPGGILAGLVLVGA